MKVGMMAMKMRLMFWKTRMWLLYMPYHLFDRHHHWRRFRSPRYGFQTDIRLWSLQAESGESWLCGFGWAIRGDDASTCSFKILLKEDRRIVGSLLANAISLPSYSGFSSSSLYALPKRRTSVQTFKSTGSVKIGFSPSRRSTSQSWGSLKEHHLVIASAKHVLTW